MLNVFIKNKMAPIGMISWYTCINLNNEIRILSRHVNYQSCKLDLDYYKEAEIDYINVKLRCRHDMGYITHWGKV